MYREVHSHQDQVKLQEDLAKLETWASKWGMRFNAKKCYVMSTKSNRPFFYQLGGQILQCVENSPYLGIHLASNLKWSTHIAHACKKAGSTLGFLRRNLGNWPPECRRLAYLSLVRSSLDYGATVWHPHLVKDRNKLERIQRQAARFIKRDYKSREPGCVTQMLNELKLPTLHERRSEQRLTMFYKIVKHQIPALPPDKFLTPVDQTKRKIRARTYEGYENTSFIRNYEYKNSLAFKVPPQPAQSSTRALSSCRRH